MQSIDGSGHKRVNVGINRVVYWTNVYDHSIKRTTGEEAMEAEHVELQIKKVATDTSYHQPYNTGPCYQYSYQLPSFGRHVSNCHIDNLCWWYLSDLIMSVGGDS